MRLNNALTEKYQFFKTELVSGNLCRPATHGIPLPDIPLNNTDSNSSRQKPYISIDREACSEENYLNINEINESGASLFSLVIVLIQYQGFRNRRAC